MIEISTILGTASTTENTKRVTRIELDESQLEALILQAVHRQNPGLASVRCVKIEIEFTCRQDCVTGALVSITQEAVEQTNN